MRRDGCLIYDWPPLGRTRWISGPVDWWLLASPGGCTWQIRAMPAGPSRCHQSWAAEAPASLSPIHPKLKRQQSVHINYLFPYIYIPYVYIDVYGCIFSCILDIVCVWSLPTYHLRILTNTHTRKKSNISCLKQAFSVSKLRQAWKIQNPKPKYFFRARIFKTENTRFKKLTVFNQVWIILKSTHIWTKNQNDLIIK